MLVTEYERIEDERGWIQDLVLSPDEVHGVTKIFTKAGAVRGNHWHEYTRQYCHVVSGELRILTRPMTGDPKQRSTISETFIREGDTWLDTPNVAHAWEAVGDTMVIVYTEGPRSGSRYESDTHRLEPDDLLIGDKIALHGLWDLGNCGISQESLITRIDGSLWMEANAVQDMKNSIRESIQEYVDHAITAWREDRDRRTPGSERDLAIHYVDAFQSVRASILGETLE